MSAAQRQERPVDAPHADADLAQFAGIFADIARTLESPHDADPRIGHVLSLVRTLVPCDRCALYRLPSDHGRSLIVVPPAPETDADAELSTLLQNVLCFLDDGGERPRLFDSRAHLALPVIGLDQILGVLFVDREHSDGYAPHHLRLLSAVCSQLGAYLMMGRLHQETAHQASLLKDREQQLRGTARFREEFIGVVGHDLRNPLSAIRTGAQLLMKRAGLNANDYTIAERVALSADRMSRMIDDLLDFTRGRLGGGIPLRRSPVDLRLLCADVVEEAETAHARAVHLEVSGNPRGHWDSDRLSQLVSNLVGNALQHSPPETAVRLTVRDAHECALLEVNNQGAPIPADRLHQIFEPFRRGETTTSAGLGLGLYIAERIVDAHGGTITVASTEQEGTTFFVRLPRSRAGDRTLRLTPARKTSAP